MNRKLRAYLDFVRFPNLFTAAADILAGSFFATERIHGSSELTRLILGSVFMYAGGVALNDVCDADKDAYERPIRPIPSGAIALPTARTISGIMLTIGVALAATVSRESAVVSVLLLICIVLYDSILKTTVLAPALMGMCRALNLLLGMTTCHAILPSAALPCGMMWLYVTSLTFFARKETTANSRTRLAAGTAGVGIACVGLLVIRGHWPDSWDVRCTAVIVATMLLIAQGIRAIRDPVPAKIQSAVKTFVISIIVIDALIASFGTGVKGGAIVLCLIIPTMLAARLLRVT